MGKHVGILTSGGDSPGLNAAIRAIGKAVAQGNHAAADRAQFILTVSQMAGMQLA